jgi:hypothetical protein
MSHELLYDSDDDCVILRVKGRVTMALVRELAPQVATLFEENSCRRLLNDMSAATIDMSVADLYGSPEVMDESGVMRGTRRALVVSPDFDDDRFLENVSRNRGHNLMIFKSVDEAKVWLLEEQK